MDRASARKRVAVVGGGISGLAAAHRLVELQADVTLYEATSRLGGVLETIQRDGFLIEGGADNWITNVPWATELCQRLDFSDQIVETNAAHRRAFVVHKGRLQPIPPGFVVMAPSRVWPLLTTPILSPWGKLRLACEAWLPPGGRDSGDESLASFVRRRLGRETYERLVQPLIGGIYTGDPEKLSLRATLPRFADMEREHGSLLRGMRRQQRQHAVTQTSSGARYSMFVAPRQGMSSLVARIAARLPADAVRCGTPVTAVRPGDGGWIVETAGGDQQHYAALILATSANVSARLLAPVDGPLADELAAIPLASCSIVSLGYRRNQIAHPLDGFGFVVPLIEQRQILSGSFSSVKFPGRAPADAALIRVFVGGACQPELADLPDDRLCETAHGELAELLGIDGPPQLTEISRRPATMPQYYVGHAARVARIRERYAAHPGLFLAGNALAGVGIPICIRGGEEAAQAACDA